jgi:hypothetical protein
MIPNYNLSAPTEADVLAALERVFGRERGRSIWTEACGMAGLAVGQASTGAALELTLQALAGIGGAAATVSRSIVIRMRTYTQLVARSAATATGARR